jgi:hypothetical protein
MAKSSTSGRGRNGNGGSRGIFDDILGMAGSLAGSRKDYAATKLETLAESVREFASAVPEIPNVEAYARTAAESLEGLAQYITESDVETMVEDAREFARNHPVVTLAGTVAAGLIVVQMMHTRRSPKSRSRSGASRTGSAALESRANV